MPSVGGVSAVHLVEDVAVRVNNPDPIPVSISGGGGGAMNVVVTNEVEVKNDAGNPLTVGGTVAATQSGVWSVGRTWNLVFANDKTDVSGSAVAVSNFPATQAVSGTVAVSNFPTTQAVSGTVSVSNFPATQAVSGTVAVNNFPATQAVSGTVTANLGTLNGAATAANQTTGNTSLASLDGKTPDESGTWGYNAGTSGTLSVAANKRIVQITAAAGALVGGTMTINGGQTITIPPNGTIAITPKANLVAPTIVFTSTTAYFVEFVE